MDENPELRKIALTGAKKLAKALVDSLERQSELKPGERQDYEKSPAHIIEEIQTFCRFL